MIVEVTSRIRINDIVNRDDSIDAVISITDPEYDNVVLNIDEEKVLRLCFHDVDDKYAGNLPYIVKFNTDMAKQVSSFLESHNIQHLVVHCEAGISRSAGMAAAICEHLQNGQNEFKTHPFIPNQLIYKLTLEALKGNQKNDS